MSPIFVWSLADSTEMRSVLLWSKVVIVTKDARVISMEVHETPDFARRMALHVTQAAEERGLWLIGIHGHRGWNDLPTSMASAHQLHILGRQEQALAVMVDSIAKCVVREGEDLGD